MKRHVKASFQRNLLPNAKIVFPRVAGYTIIGVISLIAVVVFYAPVGAFFAAAWSALFIEPSDPRAVPIAFWPAVWKLARGFLLVRIQDYFGLRGLRIFAVGALGGMLTGIFLGIAKGRLDRLGAMVIGLAVTMSISFGILVWISMLGRAANGIGLGTMVIQAYSLWLGIPLPVHLLSGLMAGSFIFTWRRHSKLGWETN